MSKLSIGSAFDCVFSCLRDKSTRNVKLDTNNQASSPDNVKTFEEMWEGWLIKKQFPSLEIITLGHATIHFGCPWGRGYHVIISSQSNHMWIHPVSFSIVPNISHHFSPLFSKIFPYKLTKPKSWRLNHFPMVDLSRLERQIASTSSSFSSLSSWRCVRFPCSRHVMSATLSARRSCF